jgi:hypothetical protein
VPISADYFDLVPFKKPPDAPLAIASCEVEAISYFGESAKVGRHSSLATLEVFVAIDLSLQIVVHRKILTLATADGSLRSGTSGYSRISP